MEKKILVVDDETDLSNMIGMRLKSEGFETHLAASAAEALHIVREIVPDLILLDIRMPETDGFELLRRLKQEQSTIRIPVIMLTALDDDESKYRSSAFYADDYMTKPIDFEKLIAKMKHILQLRDQMDA